ncbi:hypothetical protein E2C01_101601 [Portunus trituberculatus]|uniref:Uncharacterized protein n=1 Tax=Portunus trituberculatus TaxID=210409 RepID=A0A5B7K628_PORTR|nr:hypothetical protein [Portunus trituberculatus]
MSSAATRHVSRSGGGGGGEGEGVFVMPSSWPPQALINIIKGARIAPQPLPPAQGNCNENNF